MCGANKIRYANEFNRPFLAITGGHGETWDLGNVRNGIGISMRGMIYVHISADGQSATIGGGTQSGEVIASLWARGKQAGLSDSLLVSTVFFRADPRVCFHSCHSVRLRGHHRSHARWWPRLASGAARPAD